MKSKQKLRNTNQFKKKKNKQKNEKRTQFQSFTKCLNPPKKMSIKHFPETVNFRRFIVEMEELFKSEDMNVKKTEIEENDIQSTLWNGIINKWVINETINTKCIRYQSSLFDLGFTPYENGIQLYKISINPMLQKKGIGKDIMNKILKIVDDLNIEISLIPIPFEYNIPLEKLKTFYKNLGFQKDIFSPYWRYNSIRNKQFEIENFSMVA
jgi:hypothetical protein